MNTDGIPPITLLSLWHCVVALLWATLVFASIAGWGGLGLWLATRRRRVKAGMALLAGVPVMLMLGGLVNLAHAVTRPVLLTLIGAGVALALVFLKKPASDEARPKSVSRTAKVLMLLAGLLMGWRLVSAVHAAGYQAQDDFNYYLAAPEKMLQTHQLGVDQYSDKRVVSTVGGAPWLETLWLVERPLDEVQMADWALGSLLLGFVAWGVGKEFKLETTQRAFLLFAVLLTPQLRFNLTFVVLPSALFLAMVWVAIRREWIVDRPVAQALLLGGVAGSIACMKSTYITHVVMFCGLLVALRLWKVGAASAVRLGLLMGVGFLIVMLPWMLADHAAVGTGFFPLLGKGTDYTAYGQYPGPASLSLKLLMMKVVAFCVPMILILGAELIWGAKDEQSLVAMALLAAAIGASLINGAATGGDSMRRYNYPCILPGILLAYAVFAHKRNKSGVARSWLWVEATAGLLTVVVALNTGMMTFTDEFRYYWLSMHTSLADYTAVSKYSRAEYAALDRALPTDGAILTTVNMPFLLDFTKHNILLADWPGTASPKPGWPARQDGEALARYLQGQGVRYLAFSYDECSQTPQEEHCRQSLQNEFERNRADPKTTTWVKSQKQAASDARAQYFQLGQTRRHVFDDGRIFVLDLTEKNAG